MKTIDEHAQAWLEYKRTAIIYVDVVQNADKTCWYWRMYMNGCLYTESKQNFVTHVEARGDIVRRYDFVVALGGAY